MEPSDPDHELHTIAATVVALRQRWSGIRLVPGGLDRRPEQPQGRVSRILSVVTLMVGLKRGLGFRRADGGWHRLATDEVYLLRRGQWQERDISRDYDQLRLAFFESEVDLLRNRNDRRTGIILPHPERHRWAMLLELVQTGDAEQIHAAGALLLAEVATALDRPSRFPSRGERRFQALCDHLRESLADEHSRESLAATIDCHPGHVTRLFTRHAGCSYGTWLEHERLARVRELLRESDLTLEAIATNCGFGSANYLVRRFRAATGTTPTRWRRSGGRR